MFYPSKERDYFFLTAAIFKDRQLLIARILQCLHEISSYI